MTEAHTTGPEYHAAHTLDDGTRIEIRHIRPDDAGELRRAFESLSPESRYRRFFGGVPYLSDETLRYLTQVDGTDHVALVAEAPSPDLKAARGVGVARFVRSKTEHDVAEAAITVVDDMQRKGLGRLLLNTLAQSARERGIKRFRADVLASNAPMRHILADIGAPIVREDAESLTSDVTIELPEPARQNTLARLLREAASSMGVLIRTMRPREGHGD